MATNRGDVSYDEFKATVDKFEKQGVEWTNAMVLLITGGSHSTITKFRRRLDQERAQVLSEVQIHPELIQAMQQEIVLAVARERANGAEQLRRCNALLDEVTRTVGELEEQRDQALKEAESLKVERDTLAGRAAAQSTENARLLKELEIARRAAENVRIELNQVQGAQKLAAEELGTQRAETERLRVKVQQEQTARTNAEREQAKAEEARAALELRLTEMRKVLEQRVEEAQHREQEAHRREQAGQEVIAELRQRLEARTTEQHTAAAAPARARSGSRAHGKGTPANTKRVRARPAG